MTRRALLFSALLCAALQADDRILNSKHDLSALGPGPIRATGENQVCIFCHTPHNASPAAPLWNRSNPQTHYRVYRSSTTDARIGQPTGPSKQCLSCHDGSIALGLVLSRDTPIPMNETNMPSGPANLTNDLSDDHPIGFRFDRTLANRDRQLRDPGLVDSRIVLGERGELECTACHDPHNNELGDFLRIPTREGALCITCHQLDGWRGSAHAVSGKAVPRAMLDDTEPLQFESLADNACAACHVSHGAEQRNQLLRARSYDLCIGCHDGITAVDVHNVSGRRSGHQPARFRPVHDPDEDPRTMPAHVECVDCHNPHAVRPDPFANTGALGANAIASLSPALAETPGISLGGSPVERASADYEVCFRCHADNPVPIANRIRRDREELGNIRRQFLPSTASAHPVTFVSQNVAETPSLLPAARTDRVLTCQDCHNNPDARELGGSGPNGPHGSRFDFLLAARYETADFTAESPQSYALCYQCHDRNSILGDESFSLHRVHVVDGRSPCSACHTAHGVGGSAREHSHLINFDISIVSGERQFIDTGRFEGNCTLTCHGVRHVNFTYGAAAP